MLVPRRPASERTLTYFTHYAGVGVLDRVLAARDRAITDEAREHYDASTLEDARCLLVQHGRACLAQGGQDRHWYLVLDFKTQKRSRYYAFQDWADTPEGDKHLWKRDKRSGRWSPIPRESDTGRFVIPRAAKTAFKNHCDHIFGGQIWFDVLNQMGGCPAEFVDACNAVINQRRQVAF